MTLSGGRPNGSAKESTRCIHIRVLGVAPFVDDNPDPEVVEVSLLAAPMNVTFDDGRVVPMFAFNGQIPGPLLQAKLGDRVIVHFTNQLSEPTTIHWHGVRVSDSMDGSPRISSPIQPGESFTYDFVVRDAGSFWYHPHMHSNLQVEMGLYGPIVVRGSADPEFDVERFFTVDDLLLDANGRVAAPLATPMESHHGRIGNHLFTNGRLDAVSLPAIEAGQVERWRLVNAANARTMSLSLSGARFRVIGTDGGLLRAPYTVQRLEMASGQRYDLEVVFDEPGHVALSSLVLTADADGQAREIAVPIVETEVSPSTRAPRVITYPASQVPELRAASAEVRLELDSTGGGHHASHLGWRINGQMHPEAPIFTIPEGSAVRLLFVNRDAPEHPFHLHGQFFEILENGQRSTREPGLKDTVLVPGRATVEVLAYLDNPGRWMLHCHILEHAELGMMAEYIVNPAAAENRP